MTFTNKAAAEMAGRSRAALGETVAPHWIGTFHGLGARRLRIEPEVAVPESRGGFRRTMATAPRSGASRMRRSPAQCDGSPFPIAITAAAMERRLASSTTSRPSTASTADCAGRPIRPGGHGHLRRSTPLPGPRCRGVSEWRGTGRWRATRRRSPQGEVASAPAAARAATPLPRPPTRGRGDGNAPP